MAVTRESGPHVVSQDWPPLGGSSDQLGASAFAHGAGIAHTAILPAVGGGVTDLSAHWYAFDQVLLIDAVPATLNAANIVASAVPVAGTPMTLAAASTGITVVAAPGFQLVNTTPLVPTGSLCIDGLPAVSVVPGALGGTAAFDPRTMVNRCVRVTSVGNDSTATVTVVGYDVYCQRVTQTVAGANASSVVLPKALKFVTSVTWSGTLSGSAVTVGTTDTYGFPLAVTEFPMATINWAGALITAATGFTAAVTTAPSTAALGDVRGTYATQSASNGTNRMYMSVSPKPWDLAVYGTGGTNSGLFGVQQV